MDEAAIMGIGMGKAMARTMMMILSSLVCPILAAQPAPVTMAMGSVDVYPIGTNFSFYEDSTGMLSFDDILQKDRQGQFLEAQTGDLVQGTTHSVFWLRLSFYNKTDERNWVLSPLNPHMNAQVYRSSSVVGPLPQTAAGDRYDNALVELEVNNKEILYVRANGVYITDLRFEVIPNSMYFQKERQELIFATLLCGLFLGLIFYNVFLFFILRDTNYFYYLLYAVLNCHLTLISMKFPADIFHLGGINWEPIIFIYRPLGPLALTLFTRSFLQTPKNYPRMDRLFHYYTIGLFLIIGAAWLTSPATPALIVFQDFYFMIGIILWVGAAIYCRLQGFKPAIFYIFGIGIYAIGTFIYLAAGQGLVPLQSWTLYAPATGQGIQLLLMSLALADKIRLVEGERTRFAAISQYKSRLLKLISHDIANPLTVIKGTEHIVWPQKDTKTTMDRILRSADKIHEIMRFVIKTETLEDENQIELSPVRLREVFDDLNFLFEGRAREKNIRLEFKLVDSELCVRAEKTSLTNEVLANLLSNAIKFSYPDSHVQISAEEQADGGAVLISVEDQGIGMNRGMREKILLKAYQGKCRRGTNGETGSGYGLALADAYIRAYQGQLRLKSWTEEEGMTRTGTLWQVVIPTVVKPKPLFNLSWPIDVWQRLWKVN